MYHEDIKEVLKLRNKYINIYFIISANILCIEMNDVSVKLCLLALIFAINVSVGLLQSANWQFLSIGKMFTEDKIFVYFAERFAQ